IRAHINRVGWSLLKWADVVSHLKSSAGNLHKIGTNNEEGFTRAPNFKIVESHLCSIAGIETGETVSIVCRVGYACQILAVHVERKVSSFNSYLKLVRI